MGRKWQLGMPGSLIKTRVIELFRPFSGRADYKGARGYASAPNKSGHCKSIKCTEFTPGAAKNAATASSVRQKPQTSATNTEAMRTQKHSGSLFSDAKSTSANTMPIGGQNRDAIKFRPYNPFPIATKSLLSTKPVNNSVHEPLVIVPSPRERYPKEGCSIRGRCKQHCNQLRKNSPHVA